LPISLGGFEPRIAYDSCSGLLYLADYSTTPFYSYDPVSGTQTTLSSMPGSYTEFMDGFCGDRSGHIYAMSNSSTVYQYDITSATWSALPSGPTSGSNSACGVGADGYLYMTDPGAGSAMWRIQLN